MHRLGRVTIMTVRVTGLVQIILGIIIWTGHGIALIPVHVVIGLVFVLALWCLAAVGTRAGVRMGLIVRTVIWGLIVLWLGMVQRQTLIGTYHIYIRVLHLVVGLVAIGVAEVVGARIAKGHGREEPSV